MSAPPPDSALRGELRLLLTAVQYFTRVPVPAWVGHSTTQLNGCVRYFPLVGIGVGALSAGVLLLADLALPHAAAVLLAMAATAGLTGGFHEDGLADTFDGLGATADRERALEIMKDSRLGTFGALALFFVLSLKFAALAGLSPPLAAPALIAGHALSRWCSILVIWRLDYIRPEESSRSKPLVHALRSGELAVATAFALVPLVLLHRIPALAGLAAAALTVIVLARWFSRRLQGYTGDMLGAVQQLTEVAFYLSLLAAWNSY